MVVKGEDDGGGLKPKHLQLQKGRRVQEGFLTLTLQGLWLQIPNLKGEKEYISIVLWWS